MIEITTALMQITNNLQPIFEEIGFEFVIPEGVGKGELPATFDGKGYSIIATSQNGSVKFLCGENKFSVHISDEPYSEAASYTPVSTLLLDPETADDKDIKFITNEVEDTIRGKFTTKKLETHSSKKMPTPVSKAAVKSGVAEFDSVSLANRLTLIYTDLRDEYKANVDRYGRFLAEEFFSEHIAPAVLKTIKENNPQKMKKLFNLLNEVYDNGSTDVQDMIAVTILGVLDNDQVLLASCIDYMSDTLCPIVIHVNKYLATPAGKKAKAQLKNPPLYKPPKDKKVKVSLADRMMQNQ